MGRNGCGDINGFETTILEHFSGVGVLALDTKLFASRIKLYRVSVAQRNDFHSLDSTPSPQLVLGKKATTYQCNIQVPFSQNKLITLSYQYTVDMLFQGKDNKWQTTTHNRMTAQRVLLLDKNCPTKYMNGSGQ